MRQGGDGTQTKAPVAESETDVKEHTDQRNEKGNIGFPFDIGCNGGPYTLQSLYIIRLKLLIGDILPMMGLTPL